MQFLPEHLYHVYNQGNNGEQLFFERENYLYFLNKIRKHILPHADLFAWCLMPNHYHLFLKVKSNYIYSDNQIVNPLNRGIAITQSSYTQAVNKKLNRKGSLFRPRAKAKCLSDYSDSKDDYDINCFLYIHQNPLRAGLCNRLEDWEFSSYLDYLGSRSGSLCNKELAQQHLHFPTDIQAFETFSHQTIPEKYIHEIST